MKFLKNKGKNFKNFKIKKFGPGILWYRPGMVTSFVAGIFPCYRGRNGSLPSIGWKGKFLHVQNAEKESRTERKVNGQETTVIPSENKVRDSLREHENNY